MPSSLISARKSLTYSDLFAQHQTQYIPYDLLLKTEEWQEKRQKILKRDHCQCTKCGTSGISSLHVHHTYYSVQKVSLKKNKFIHNLPWEYPDEALVTVCNECHQEIHKTTKIKIFEEILPGKYAEKDFTPCYRCKGIGYFTCYKHIQRGICFRCHGQRFEELR